MSRALAMVVAASIGWPGVTAHATTFPTEMKRCAVCGCTSKQRTLPPAFEFESRDLDNRPGRFLRIVDTLLFELCPRCHYCSYNIARCDDSTAQVVRSRDYRDQYRDRSFPRLAKLFLCAARIAEGRSNYSGAALYGVRAAWACDDAGADDRARVCRARAIEWLRVAHERGRQLLLERAGDDILLADLLRRSGRFAEAEAACVDGLSRRPGRLIAAALRYEISLIRNSDPGCHTIQEALDYYHQSFELGA